MVVHSLALRWCPMHVPGRGDLRSSDVAIGRERLHGVPVLGEGERARAASWRCCPRAMNSAFDGSNSCARDIAAANSSGEVRMRTVRGRLEYPELMTVSLFHDLPFGKGVPHPVIPARDSASSRQSDRTSTAVGSRARATPKLFAQTMSALDSTRPRRLYDLVPWHNPRHRPLVSFFGLHRRWRGALVGHLAAFEIDVGHPMGR